MKRLLIVLLGIAVTYSLYPSYTDVRKCFAKPGTATSKETTGEECCALFGQKLGSAGNTRCYLDGSEDVGVRKLDVKACFCENTGGELLEIHPSFDDTPCQEHCIRNKQMEVKTGATPGDKVFCVPSNVSGPTGQGPQSYAGKCICVCDPTKPRKSEKLPMHPVWDHKPCLPLCLSLKKTEHAEGATPGNVVYCEPGTGQCYCYCDPDKKHPNAVQIKVPLGSGISDCQTHCKNQKKGKALTANVECAGNDCICVCEAT